MAEGYHNNYTRFVTAEETTMQTTSEQLTEMHQTVQQLLRKLEMTERGPSRKSDPPIPIALVGNHGTGCRGAYYEYWLRSHSTRTD